jgi:hypothetical protein
MKGAEGLLGIEPGTDQPEHLLPVQDYLPYWEIPGVANRAACT